MSTPLCINFTNAAVNGFFANLSSRFWWLFLKGCVGGSLAAPSLSSPILNTLIFSAAVLFRGSLSFFMPPLTRGPLLAHLQKLPCHPVPWGCVRCVPSSFPWRAFPGGGPRWFALTAGPRSGRLSNAPRHLRLSDALCTGRGASRRLPTSVAASGSSLPAALARRAPTTGVRPGGALTARPPRSAGRGPRERRPGPPTSSARAAAARAPLLARLGVLACEAVFPSPVVLRRLAAPCVLPCSFLCF